MSYKILFSPFIILCFIVLGNVEAGQAPKSQTTKFNPHQKEILKATTKADFEKILCKWSLIDPLDDSRGKTIDAAMKIPLSKRLLIFYYVTKSAYRSIHNDAYFKIFSDLSDEDIADLFESVSLFFPRIESQCECQTLYDIFKLVKTERRYKLAKYINSIIPHNMKDDLTWFVRKVASIQEDDLPEVMGRVMTIAKEMSDAGISDLISAISDISKDRRDLILSEAKKLSTPTMETIDKAHLINGLNHLKPEDFFDIVTLGKQLFFADTHGGHRNLILTTLQRIEKEKRCSFVSQVKPLLKSEDPMMLRSEIIRIFAQFEENDRLTFIRYLPQKINVEIKIKIFDNLDYLQGKEIKTVLSYIKEHLPEKPVNEEKLLTAILSSIQMIKLNR